MNPHTDTHVADFMRMARTSPRLSREEEAELLSAWYKDGQRQALDRVLESQLRYVVAIALKYRRYGIPLAELIAEGNVGLVHATTKFRPDQGTRLVTYASHWIRARMLDHVIRSWSLVKAGTGALNSKLFFKLRRERATLVGRLGEGAHVDSELATRLGMPQDVLQSMLARLERRDASLDAPLGDDSGSTHLDALMDPRDAADTRLASHRVQVLQRDVVARALDCLDPRERLVVEERLMAAPEDELSLSELALRFGVSRERARQLELRAKRKLKRRIEVFIRAGQLQPSDLLLSA